MCLGWVVLLYVMVCCTSSVVVGIVLGGVIIFVLKIRGKKLPFMMVVIQVLAVPLMFGFFASCPTIDIPGVTTAFADG